MGFVLDIAGLAIEATSDDDLPIDVEGSARKFVRDPAAPPVEPFVRLHARWGDPQSPSDAPVLFDPGKGLWRAYRRPGGEMELTFTSPMLGAAPYQSARFSPDFRRGEITLRRASFAGRPWIYPLHYPLDEVFMVHLLAASGLGVELHGAGVVLPDGRGWLFVGHSGAGKSTIARLWRGHAGVKVLSDERIIVRAHDDGSVWMYGTPWHGDGYIAEQGRARLDRVFVLGHGAHNQLERLPATAAVAKLFACGFTPFHDAAGLDGSLGLLTEITRAARCERFAFVPDRGALEFALAS
jgi:hypothetical protein